MPKKYITIQEALKKEEEIYNHLKAKSKVGRQAEAERLTCPECKAWEAAFAYYIAWLDAEHDRLQNEEYREGDEGNYLTANEFNVRKSQVYDDLAHARQCRDEAAGFTEEFPSEK